MRRKTTSAERGLPGSPMTGTSPASASSVGLPGGWRCRGTRCRARRAGDDGGRLVARPDRRAGRDHDEVGCRRPRRRAARRARAGRRRRSRSGRGIAARLAHERGERRGARVAHLADLRASRSPGATTSSPVETIATRGRACTSSAVTPGGGQHAEVLRAQRPPGGQQLGARRGVLVGADDAVAGRHGPHHLDRPGHRLLRVLDHDDGVGALGQHAAGRHRDRALRARRRPPARAPSRPRRSRRAGWAGPPRRRRCRPRAPRSRRRSSARSPGRSCGARTASTGHAPVAVEQRDLLG